MDHRVQLILLILFGLSNQLNANPFRGQAVNVNPNSIYTGGSCKERGLCCTGRDSSCTVSILRNSAIANSVSLIGNLINVADNTAKECYCDSACITLGDCCPDYKETCGVRDCVVGEWDNWSECNATCGVGIMSRSRTALSPAQNGGKECPDLHQKRACHGQRCEVKDDQKMLRETAIILQSSFSSTRNVDQDQDIRRNLRLNYPKDPLKENVIEYCVLFEVTKSSMACKTLSTEISSKLQEGSRVCVQCQEAAMRRHLGYRCYGHGAVGKSTRWSTLVNSGCHGRWKRLDDQQAATICNINQRQSNSTVPNGTLVPAFIFV